MYRFDNCIFTGLPFIDIRRGIDGVGYTIGMPYGNVLIMIPLEASLWEENEFFLKNKYIFEGLLLNNNWFDDTTQLITIERLQELLSQKTYPNTPKDKADTLFQELLKLQNEDGENVNMMNDPISFKQLFFKSEMELFFYIEYLTSENLINSVTDFIDRRRKFVSFSMTVKGLNYGIQLQTEGDKSNLCFIAMSFKEGTSEIRAAIISALNETEFKPLIIDEVHINSDVTINDEIIASLKRCKFCVADFKNHSNGVYFESGYAAGQGKKVIYTVPESELKDAHFDTRSFQHIVYKDTEQLKKRLIDKIEAWVI